MPVDPKGYYTILGVAVSASSPEIKHAFRQRAIVLHPDRNKATNAIEMFLLLKEAYETLSNPSRRAAYDIWQSHERDGDDDAETPGKKVETEPMLCSVCSKTTAQPRYVIFFRVKSYVVGSGRTSTQGIFCSDCAAKAAIRASFSTWALGWWAVPFGPFYTVHALMRNLLGGVKPRDINARIAAHQAWHFVSVGQPALARAVALEAMKLAGPKTRQAAELKASLGRVMDLTDGLPRRRLRNSWTLVRRAFFLQAAPVAVAIVLGAYGLWALIQVPPSAPVVAEVVEPVKPPPAPPKPGPAAPRYVRPPIADNGMPWPTITSYIPGYPRRFTEGRSTLTVDNTKNDADVFVKLFRANTKPRVLARAFFITAGSQFKVESLESGAYDLRYRNLRSGAIVRSDPLEFNEIAGDNSVKVTSMRVTLYEISEGTLRTRPIPEDEFE